MFYSRRLRHTGYIRQTDNDYYCCVCPSNLYSGLMSKTEDTRWRFRCRASMDYSFPLQLIFD